MGRTKTSKKAGNGAFVESCLEHCGAQTGSFFDNVSSVDGALGGKTMQQAHSDW